MLDQVIVKRLRKSAHVLYLNSFIVIFMLLTACATTAPGSRVGSDSEKNRALNTTPVNSDMAVVYIVRDDITQNSAVTALIGVDRHRLIALDDNGFTRVELPPGLYKFKFVVNAEDYDKSSSDYSHGSKNILIKHGVVNIIRFEGGDFNFSKDMLYGKKYLSNLIREHDYQVPYLPSVANLKSLPMDPTLAQPALAASPRAASKARPEQPPVISAQFSRLESIAKCKLKNTSWVYTGQSCKNGLAHGEGSAEDKQGLKFIGTFVSGQRTKGEIHQDGNMIFSGSLVNDKPEGDAICLHENEYEECRFFRGKRIDTLYKIRKENAKMNARTGYAQPASLQTSGGQAKGLTDYAVDAVQQEAIDRTADFIFDSLF